MCDCPIHKMLLSPLNYDIIVDIRAIKTLGKNRPACVVACLHADGGYIDFFI